MTWFDPSDQMYGKRGMWLLKEDNYSVVQDALFEKQEREERRQRLLVQEEPNKVTSLPISSLVPISRVLLLFMISFHVSPIN
jgi:cytochrome c-type biogenesis protein CcmH/NrfG